MDTLLRLNVNDIYIERETGRRFRILWVSKSQSVFAYELDQRNGFPFLVSMRELAEKLEDELIFFEREQVVSLRTKEVSENDIRKRDEIWEILGEALMNEPDIYDKKKRTQMLDEIQARSNIAKRNLYRLMRRYWQEGKKKDCFLPKYSCKSRRTLVSTSKRGTKARDGKRGICLTEEDYEKFQKGFHDFYLNKKGNSLETAYTLMLGDHYSTPVFDTEGNIIEKKLLPEECLPSFWQFRYWYRTNTKTKEVLTARLGEGEFELNHDDELFRADYGVRGPGVEYQVDATVADVYLVSPYNRDDIIGRPVVYLVVDVFSRMITGLYVGLEGPSWNGMMMALYNAFTSKTSYCKEYGIEITDEQWPCSYLPDTLLGDRGELFSKKAIGLVEMLGIRVDNTPPYMGLCKPFVERMFKTIDGNTTVFIPGRVKASTHRRGGKDYRLDAILNIHEFTAIMIKAVLQCNNNRVLETLEIPEAVMRADADLEMHALNLWNWGIANYGGLLRKANEKDIRLALMPRDKGSIMKKGVRFKQRYYTCPTFEELGLFVNAKEKGSEKVDVSYDLRDVSKVYVWRKGEDSPYLCEMMNWEEKYKGLTCEEFDFVTSRWKKKRNSGKRDEQQGTIDMKKYIDNVVNNAKEEASQMEILKGQKTKNIGENRRQAKEEERQEQAFTGAKYEEKAEGDGQTSDKPQEKELGNPIIPEEKKAGGKMTPAMRKIFESIEKRNQGGMANQDDTGKGSFES